MQGRQILYGVGVACVQWKAGIPLIIAGSGDPLDDRAYFVNVQTRTISTFNADFIK